MRVSGSLAVRARPGAGPDGNASARTTSDPSGGDTTACHSRRGRPDTHATTLAGEAGDPNDASAGSSASNGTGTRRAATRCAAATGARRYDDHRDGHEWRIAP